MTTGTVSNVCFEVYTGRTICTYGHPKIRRTWTWTPYPPSSNNAGDNMRACFMHLGMPVCIMYICVMYMQVYSIHFFTYNNT